MAFPLAAAVVSDTKWSKGVCAAGEGLGYVEENVGGGAEKEQILYKRHFTITMHTLFTPKCCHLLSANNYFMGFSCLL